MSHSFKEGIVSMCFVVTTSFAQRAKWLWNIPPISLPRTSMKTKNDFKKDVSNILASLLVLMSNCSCLHIYVIRQSWQCDMLHKNTIYYLLSHPIGPSSARSYPSFSHSDMSLVVCSVIWPRPKCPLGHQHFPLVL